MFLSEMGEQAKGRIVVGATSSEACAQDNRNVAQLVRASPRQGEGRRFESDRSYHFLAQRVPQHD